MSTNKKKGRSSKPALKTYRSGLEREIAKQLMLAEVPFNYEHEKLPYILIGKIHNYTPDFMIGNEIIIEAKGIFGHIGNEEACLKERHKLILLRDQHPEREIRLVFMDANQTTKDGLMTYAEWVDEHGFLWSDQGVVPEDWIIEIKQKMILQ